MSLVSPKGFPCGPYGDDAWFTAEHDHENWWETDDCTHECVHISIESMRRIVSDTRPSPYRDGIDMMDFGENYLFCFPNIDMMHEWFSGDLRWLAEIGYIVAVYEVEQFQHGAHQTVFDWTTSQRVEELPL